MSGTDPKRSIDLLEELIVLGFGDREFSVLHHFHNGGLHSHIAYCRKIGSFREGDNNAKVQVRLELVLAAYQRGGFKSELQRPEVLLALAHAAVAEVPA